MCVYHSQMFVDIVNVVFPMLMYEACGFYFRLVFSEILLFIYVYNFIVAKNKYIVDVEWNQLNKNICCLFIYLVTQFIRVSVARKISMWIFPNQLVLVILVFYWLIRANLRPTFNQYTTKWLVTFFRLCWLKPRMIA